MSRLCWLRTKFYEDIWIEGDHIRMLCAIRSDGQKFTAYMPYDEYTDDDIEEALKALRDCLDAMLQEPSFSVDANAGEAKRKRLCHYGKRIEGWVEEPDGGGDGAGTFDAGSVVQGDAGVRPS